MRNANKPKRRLNVDLMDFWIWYLIPCRYSSCSCWGDGYQKAQGFVGSNPIGMKFGTVVPRLNTHQSSESGFGYDVTLSRWRPWWHFV